MQADVAHGAAFRQHLEHIFVIVVTGSFEQLRRLKDANADDGDIDFVEAGNDVGDIFAGHEAIFLLSGAFNALGRQ